MFPGLGEEGEVFASSSRGAKPKPDDSVTGLDGEQYHSKDLWGEEEEGGECNGLFEQEAAQRLELATVKESMKELESVVEFVKDKVEEFVSSESSWLKEENQRLRRVELEGDLRNSPEVVLASLPEELWIQVLGYLDVGELCEVGLVSKGFLRLSRDPGLWHTITLLGDALAETSTVLALISRCSQLRRISITARDDAAMLVMCLAASCPLLREVTVKYCPPVPHCDLRCLSLGCPNLETLDLESTGALNGECGVTHPEDCTCTCSPSVSFPHLLSRLPLLTRLNLFACRNLSSSGLQILAETCPNLHSLNIDEVNYLSDESVNTLLSLRGPGLKSLWIDGESLTDASYKNFHALVQCQLLSVSFCDALGPQGLQAIAQLQHVEWLRLRRGAELEPQHFVTAFDLGRLGSALTYLDLSECSKLDDSGIAAVARNCPNLGTICLSWCWDVTDIGLGHLVHRCPALVTMGLCGVVRLQGDFLPGLDKLLPELKLLDLEQCPDVELGELQDLVRRNLGLVVRDYYGERVNPVHSLQEFLIDHPEITFITYDHEAGVDKINLRLTK